MTRDEYEQAHQRVMEMNRLLREKIEQISTWTMIGVSEGLLTREGISK
jgi:Trp operon repressor